MELLKDRTALITGSSRGIGLAVARLFAEEGARVAFHGRDTTAPSTAVNDARTAGLRVMGVIGDVTKMPDLERMRQEIEQELGAVDTLVANAGGNPVPPGPFEAISEEGWRASLDLNLTATFLTIKAFLPGMRQRKAGNIITISSAAARRPDARSPIGYAAAKAGIQLLTQDLAAQVGPDGIRANCIAPETILTENNQRRIPEALQEQLRAAHPIRRLGTPEDVAQAALYLASDRASWITGVILDVAGGAVLA